MEFSGIFWNFLVIGEYNVYILATKFSSLLLLLCYNQADTIVTLSFRVFCLLQKCLRSIVTKKLHVKIVVFKLQNLILRVTRRDVQLEPYIAPSVPTFQHCPRMI